MTTTNSAAVPTIRSHHGRRSVLWALAFSLVFVAAGDAARAQYTSGSTGIHGPFPPLPSGMMSLPAGVNATLINMTTGLVRYCSSYNTTTRLDTCGAEIAQAQIPGILPGELTTGVFEFTDVSFGGGAASVHGVWFVGNKYNRAVSILSQGNIILQSNGALRLDGGEGGTATTTLGVLLIGGVGGRPGPGGFSGGAGGDGGTILPENGSPGMGPNGGAGGVWSASYSSAYVGGNATLSQPNPRLVPLVGGSGGGGGAGVHAGSTSCGTPTFGYGGGGGAGGGGSILLAADDSIILNGPAGDARWGISAGGGQVGPGGGGIGPFWCDHSGGRGAGGSIRLVASDIRGTSSIWLGPLNGSSGFGGTSGRIVMESFTSSLSGGIYAAASMVYLNAPSAPIPSGIPTLRIAALGGLPVGQNPQNSTTTPDVSFPTPPMNPVQVDLEAGGIPLGTTIAVRLAPVNGNAVSTATSTPLSGTLASSTATAQVTVPPGVGSVSAFASFTLSAPLMASLGLTELPTLDGEKPDHVEIAAGGDGASTIYLVTPSGRRMKLDRGTTTPG